jgi:hypothetical protein
MTIQNLIEQIEKAVRGAERFGFNVDDPLATLLVDNDKTILAALRAESQLQDAAKAALEHVLELEEAWRTGAIVEADHLGGTRSSRNVDVRVLLSAALTAQQAENGGGR